MSITARDRKILAVLAVLAVVAVYWLLRLGPKREEATEAAQELTEQEERRDTAEAMLAELQTARQTFETDYATVVRLGKALPTEVDVPSLMVQLEDAAAWRRYRVRLDHGRRAHHGRYGDGTRAGWDRARARSSRRGPPRPHLPSRPRAARRHRRRTRRPAPPLPPRPSRA